LITEGSSHNMLREERRLRGNPNHGNSSSTNTFRVQYPCKAEAPFHCFIMLHLLLSSSLSAKYKNHRIKMLSFRSRNLRVTLHDPRMVDVRILSDQSTSLSVLHVIVGLRECHTASKALHFSIIRFSLNAKIWNRKGRMTTACSGATCLTIKFAHRRVEGEFTQAAFAPNSCCLISVWVMQSPVISPNVLLYPDSAADARSRPLFFCIFLTTAAILCLLSIVARDAA
jgi:hypothetical protein